MTVSTPVNNISRLVPGLVERLNPAQTQKVEGDQEKKAGFTELLSNMLQDVNGSQQEAAQLEQSFMEGGPVELHEVMIKAREAGLATDLMLEIRNKLMNAYSEIMRMPM